MSRALEKTCDGCDNAFAKDVRYSMRYWLSQRFCSRECFGRHHAKTAAEKRRPMQEEFEKHFVKGDGCWEWTAARDKDGYGIFSYARKSYRANVISLRLDGRAPLPGQYGCHTCDNPGCVKPAHLYPGTPTQNSADAVARARINAGEAHHFAKLTTADVVLIRDAEGTHDEIAARFGVARATVTLIRQRKTWRRVA